MRKQRFGGDWTEEKLKRVQRYLAEYTKIMSKQPFTFTYIDAFAGTGYRTLATDETGTDLLFPELAAQDAQRFLDGSARIALQVQPPFKKYVFIEKDPNRFVELERIKQEFTTADIRLINSDCNEWLQRICINHRSFWKENRAVLFLDPFGMQVQWKTIEAIADTRAIDLWLLFPLGMAVNRLLPKDGKIEPILRQRLSEIFGTEEWYEAFYRPRIERNLFGQEQRIEKSVTLEQIGQYFVQRLQTKFAGVATNPLPLYNSRNNPLYLLCFAAGNPRGAPIAVRIAEHILRR